MPDAPAPDANATPPPAAPPPGGEPPKVFDQEAVDRIVQDRLNRERSKFADYDDLKGKAAEFDKLQDANKTALERAQQESTTAKAEAAQAQAEAKEARLERAVVGLAAGKGIVDPDAAVALLDRGQIQYDDAGKATNLEPLLDQLLKDKPYLGSNGRGPAPLPGGSAPPANSGVTMDDWLRGQASAKGR